MLGFAQIGKKEVYPAVVKDDTSQFVQLSNIANCIPLTYLIIICISFWGVNQRRISIESEGKEKNTIVHRNSPIQFNTIKINNKGFHI